MDNPAQVIIDSIELWNQRAHEFEENFMPSTFADVRETGSRECLEELQVLLAALLSIEERLGLMAKVRGRETPYRQHFAAWTEAVMGQDHAWTSEYDFNSVITAEAFSSLEQLAYQWETEAAQSRRQGVRFRDVYALDDLLDEVERLCDSNLVVDKGIVDQIRERAQLVREERAKLDNNQEHDIVSAVRSLLMAMMLASDVADEREPGWRANVEKFLRDVTVNAGGNLMSQLGTWGGGLVLHQIVG